MTRMINSVDDDLNIFEITAPLTSLLHYLFESDALLPSTQLDPCNVNALAQIDQIYLIKGYS